MSLVDQQAGMLSSFEASACRVSSDVSYLDLTALDASKLWGACIVAAKELSFTLRMAFPFFCWLCSSFLRT